MGGHAAVDHGFARFNHFRIPMENMLSRFSMVTYDGQYVKRLHAKMSYGGVSPFVWNFRPCLIILTYFQMLYIHFISLACLSDICVLGWSLLAGGGPRHEVCLHNID